MGDVSPTRGNRTSLEHVKSWRMDVRPISYLTWPEQSPLSIQDTELRYDQGVPRIIALSVGPHSNLASLKIDDNIIKTVQMCFDPITQTAAGKFDVVEADNPFGLSVVGDELYQRFNPRKFRGYGHILNIPAPLKCPVFG